MSRRYIGRVVLSMLTFCILCFGLDAGVKDWFNKRYESATSWYDTTNKANKAEVLTALLRIPAVMLSNSLEQSSAKGAVACRFLADIVRITNNALAVYNKPGVWTERYKLTELTYDIAHVVYEINNLVKHKDNKDEESEFTEENVAFEASLSKVAKTLHCYVLPSIEGLLATVSAFEISVENEKSRLLGESLGLLSRLLSDVVVAKRGTLEFRAKIVALVVVVCASLYEMYGYFTAEVKKDGDGQPKPDKDKGKDEKGKQGSAPVPVDIKEGEDSKPVPTHEDGGKGGGSASVSGTSSKEGFDFEKIDREEEEVDHVSATPPPPGVDRVGATPPPDGELQSGPAVDSSVVREEDATVRAEAPSEKPIRRGARRKKDVEITSSDDEAYVPSRRTRGKRVSRFGGARVKRGKKLCPNGCPGVESPVIDISDDER
jgi:hypothetical protein